MRIKARLAVSLAAVAVAAYGFGPLPHGGVPAAASGSITYKFNPSPIAGPGTLNANALVNVTLTASDNSGPVSGATVYLAFVPGADSGGVTALVAGSCGAVSTTLNAQATPCTTASDGTITITYKLAGSIPTGGHDTITAGPAAGTVTASDVYDYGTVASYGFKVQTGSNPAMPSPVLGDAGNLASQEQVVLTVTALDSNGSTVSTLQNGMPPNIFVKFVRPATAPTGTLNLTSCSGTASSFSSFTSEPTTAGAITLCYEAPVKVTTTSEIDAATVQDDDSATPAAEAQIGYNGDAPSASGFSVSPSPAIASAGTLQAGDFRDVMYTVKDSGSAAVPWARVTLSFTLQPGPGTPIGKAKVGTVTLSGNGDFATDSSGVVTVRYTAGTSGTEADELSGVTYPGGTATAPQNTFYNYSQVTHYILTDVTNAMNPKPLSVPIASDGTLSPGASRKFTVTALDLSKNGVPDAIVHVDFFAASGDQTHTGVGTLGSSSGNLNNSGHDFVTDPSGNVIGFTYTLGSANIPKGGKDVLTVAGPNGSNLVSDSYKYDLLTTYSTTPSPIAPLGSLSGNSTVSVNLVGMDGGTADTSAPMWMVMNGPTGGGTAAVTQCTDGGGMAVQKLTSTPSECIPDISGVVHVSYTTPSTLPAGGGDVITMADDKSVGGTSTSVAVSGTDSYTFAGTYVFSPVNGTIAPAGTLTPGSTTPVTVTIEDAQHQPAPGASVFLVFAAASGGGTGTVSATHLTSTAQEFTADSNGQVTIQYTVSNPPASGGTDTITAQNSLTSPSVTAPDVYNYISSITALPNPIAAAASLGGNTTRQVTVTANDPHGSSAPNAVTYLSFNQATGGGTATVNGVALSGTPRKVLANGSGQITISYTTPASLPASGVDTVTIANASSNPTLWATDIYSFTPTQGYWMVATDGGIFSFGDASFHGSTGNIHLNQPIVGMTPTPDHGGYWMVASDGGIFSFGDASFHGSTGNIHLNQPIVGMAATPDGGGYWLVASDGGIFSFGDASFHGSTGNIHLNQPIVGMASTPSGKGYWLVASDGGIFSFGDATFHGSTGNIHLNKPIVGMAATPDGAGYWFVASDGGIFTFGDASFHNSAGNLPLAKPIVGMAASHDGGGYWMVASDGGIFAFGDAGFNGSMGGKPLNQPIVGMASIG